MRYQREATGMANLKRRLALSTSGIAALMVYAPSLSYAQTAATETFNNSDEIIVSTTRIKGGNFEAPTPVQSLDLELLERRGTTNVADLINELPAVQSFTSPSSTGQSSNVAGENTISLRGLGFSRTLILLDERRVVAQKPEGRVNLNAIPQALIKNIEVVTGGASAAWGSDAVAGVVNIVLDREFTGFRSTVQAGVSDNGDGEQYRLSFAAGGEFADGRGHVLVGVDYQNNPDNVRCSDLDWCDERYQLIPNSADGGAGDGIPAFITQSGARSWLGVDNGAVIGGPPAIAFTEFDQSGSFGPFDTGDGLAGLFVANGGGSDFQGRTVIQLPYERQSIMTTIDYELTDNIEFFTTAWFARTATESPTITPATGFFGGATILSGNPYIPSSFQDILTTNSIPSFQLFRSNRDLGQITADIETQTWSGTFGIRGEIADRWNWETYYQYGRSSSRMANQNNLIVANFNRATNAVLSGGEIVCQSVVDSSDPNCVPINLFGEGSPSAEATDYVLGTSVNDVWNSQEVVAANISGELFSGWAGPVLAAGGFEYRREEANGEADPISESSGFLIANLTPDRGSFNVWELFTEVNIPIMADTALGNSFDVNAAARYTDYSTVGGVVTWKVGFIYEPIDEIRIRGTYSNDIRAPSIRELFSGNRMQFSNVSDPFNGGVTSLAQVNLGGNVDLNEERGTTKSIGVILQPGGALSGLNASIDYYNIEITDAITTLGVPAIVNGCFEGNTPLCDQIIRDGGGAISEINATAINAAALKTSGVDFVLRYATDDLAPGQIDFSVTGTYVQKYLISSDGVNFIDRAGEVGLNGGAGSEAPTPHWQTTAGIGYTEGNFGAYAQARYVGGGNYDNNWTIEDIDSVDFDGQIYLDLSARYNLSDTIEVFGGVNNVLENDPPIIAAPFPGQPATNTVLYDTIGRYLYIGARIDL